MNAIEFVKEFGIDEAKKVLSKNSKSKYFCKYLNTKPFTIKDTFSNNPDLDETAWVLVDDLKQIVGAFELVEKFGGLNNAELKLKGMIDGIQDCTPLIQAIDLVEKCNA